MPKFSKSLTAARNGHLSHLLLWCVIALGLVPAIITESIIPFDIFGLQYTAALVSDYRQQLGLMNLPQLAENLPQLTDLFLEALKQGLENRDVVHLFLGLLITIFSSLIFMFGLALCLIKRRYFHVFLLLPWLALAIFPLNDLAYRLPTYSAIKSTQGFYAANASTLPYKDLTEAVSSSLKDIDDLESSTTDRYGLKEFDRDEVNKLLKEIDKGLAENGRNKNEKSDFERESIFVKKLLDQTANEISEHEQEITQLKEERKELIKEKQRFEKFNNSLGLIFSEEAKEIERDLRQNKFETEGHQRSVDDLNSRKDELESERDKVDVQIKDLNATFEDLDNKLKLLVETYANVETYARLNQAYQSWYESLYYKLLCLVVLLLLVWRFSLGSWIFMFTVLASILASMLFIDASLSLSLFLAFKFVIFALIVKVIYLIFAENLPILRQQTGAFLLRTFAQTLKYYSPFVVLILTKPNNSR